jgi:hypothetical protein
MKQLFPTSLALLLVMSSLGHVFAAALCPHAFGSDCCFAKAPGHTHALPSGYENTAMHAPMDGMHGMAMDGMAMDRTGTDDSAMKSMSATSYLPVADDDAIANKVEQPIETCTHCLSHSGILNAPLSSISVLNQSNKDLGSVQLPLSRLVRALTTLAQIGLPKEHAPPGSSAPRYILINVFLI